MLTNPIKAIEGHYRKVDGWQKNKDCQPHGDCCPDTPPPIEVGREGCGIRRWGRGLRPVARDEERPEESNIPKPVLHDGDDHTVTAQRMPEREHREQGVDRHVGQHQEAQHQPDPLALVCHLFPKAQCGPREPEENPQGTAEPDQNNNETNDPVSADQFQYLLPITHVLPTRLEEDAIEQQVSETGQE
ncbi:MAG TPA: hypothetical protein DEP84_19520 [Chloroflexi bacterium]|nr:hypothetical protein [Chloroflexota bacterium]